MNPKEGANLFEKILNKVEEAELILISKKNEFAYRKELDRFFEWEGPNAEICNEQAFLVYFLDQILLETHQMINPYLWRSWQYMVYLVLDDAMCGIVKSVY
ncbi:hypothetical protein QE152_g34278 [Popillia japonica]|uniref:Uncharacterized protein n=1 Tax=Popillia japonica TaxID=7064 RepID=A0AAW1IUF6_POPJA